MLSEDLKVELAKIFVVAFLDRMAGTPVEDEDEILVEDGARLIHMAQEYITSVESEIAAIYQENPEEVHRVVYDTGVQVADHFNQLDGPDINLN